MIAHWDEVERQRREFGHLRAWWRFLGDAVGSRGVGVRRIEIDPGGWSTPAHVHGSAEEIFYVLGGSGLSWQDGSTFEVGPGDCLVHLPCREPHTLRAGEQGLDALAFGGREVDAATLLPRAGVFWLAARWVDAGGEEHPFAREAALGEPETPSPDPRPARIIHLDSVEPSFGGRVRSLGEAAGSVRTGLNHVRLAPGEHGAPSHCHSAEEELFVVLDGEGMLELTPSPALRERGGIEKARAIRRGHVIARPPGSGIAHAFRAGEGGLVYLAYGTREPSDLVYYPETGELVLRNVGPVGTVGGGTR